MKKLWAALVKFYYLHRAAKQMQEALEMIYLAGLATKLPVSAIPEIAYNMQWVKMAIDKSKGAEWKPNSQSK